MCGRCRLHTIHGPLFGPECSLRALGIDIAKRKLNAFSYFVSLLRRAFVSCINTFRVRIDVYQFVASRRTDATNNSNSGIFVSISNNLENLYDNTHKTHDGSEAI